jgi:hypothetical protein
MCKKVEKRGRVKKTKTKSEAQNSFHAIAGWKSDKKKQKLDQKSLKKFSMNGWMYRGDGFLFFRMLLHHNEGG